MDILTKMRAAIECALALDMPHNEGLKVLQKHGFNYEDRFEIPATQFVKSMLIGASG